ncbi:hypothetical protein B0H14DRAFT_2576405 [Mycena olivaceomarginata]|nr:hypothetical protein B0H14DRAFT_2576405 [Mycena olivaceomarginata]
MGLGVNLKLQPTINNLIPTAKIKFTSTTQHWCLAFAFIQAQVELEFLSKLASMYAANAQGTHINTAGPVDIHSVTGTAGGTDLDQEQIDTISEQIVMETTTKGFGGKQHFPELCPLKWWDHPSAKEAMREPSQSRWLSSSTMASFLTGPAGPRAYNFLHGTMKLCLKALSIILLATQYWCTAVVKQPLHGIREVAVSHRSHQEPPSGSNGMWCRVATAFGGSAGG